ncbi:MAG: hypothetical protein AAF378_18715 [Cyanobacteria bacterium P01_A01_bin.84]
MFLNEDSLRDKLTAEREGRQINNDAEGTFKIEADSSLVSALNALLVQSDINPKQLGNMLVRSAIDMIMHGGNFDSLLNKDAAPTLPPMAFTTFTNAQQDDEENQDCAGFN